MTSLLRLPPHLFAISGLAFVLVGTTGCSTDAMLAKQADDVCACDTFDCGMKVLEGDTNKRLKMVDKLGGKLSEAGKKSKQRMMGCLLAFKSKELGDDPAGSATVTNAPLPTPKAAPPPAFRSSAGRYNAAFPFGSPDEKVVADAKGVRWTEAKSSIGAYTVGYADFPSNKAALAYVDSFATTMKREITSDTPVTVSGKPGRELEMRISANATMWLRYVAVDKRLYKIAAGTKNDKTKAYTFLDSFDLDD
jgi:hypothetical protein